MCSQTRNCVGSSHTRLPSAPGGQRAVGISWDTRQAPAGDMPNEFSSLQMNALVYRGMIWCTEKCSSLLINSRAYSNTPHWSSISQALRHSLVCSKCMLPCHIAWLPPAILPSVLPSSHCTHSGWSSGHYCPSRSLVWLHQPAA